ncbi:hypothetical protein [Streptomyces curacoi]|uniref:PE-PGRS family protein n=1 Tax=Streptomyces curacoi TaxID=146536 RepID=A0A117P6P8_9ACTN|nr:hypothetical protein [Streptomyces curacoi]KUM74080.1 hypothetical protein AQI70_19240 [Streptomyces curacoi]
MEQPAQHEQRTRSTQSETAEGPEQLDWLQQQRQHPSTHTELDPDPVRTVWQLPRFRLGSRRFFGRVDHALVFVTRRGKYETFLPPARPATVRRYVALYEVNTDPHSFQCRVPLPSRVDSFEFEVTADITWRVVDPAAFVKSQERDVPGFITRELLPHMRTASRGHPIEASARAEQAVQQAVRDVQPIGEEEGLRITCSIRLRRDAVERSHQARLRTARHEAEAAQPEHRASRLREKYEAERKAEKIAFYEHHLARGGIAALALHLATRPDDTQLVLEHLRKDQAELVQTQLHLIDQALENKRLEDYQLDEPHQLIAERMTAILRATAPSDDPSAPPYPELAPQSAAEEPSAPAPSATTLLKDRPESDT